MIKGQFSKSAQDDVSRGGLIPVIMWCQSTAHAVHVTGKVTINSPNT